MEGPLSERRNEKEYRSASIVWPWVAQSRAKEEKRWVLDSTRLEKDLLDDVP